MRSRNPFDVMYDIGLPQIVHFYMSNNAPFDAVLIH